MDEERAREAQNGGAPPPPPLLGGPAGTGVSRDVSGLGFFPGPGSHGFLSMDRASPEPEQAEAESGSAPAPSWLHAPAASIASLHRPGGSVMDFLASAGSCDGDNGGDASLRRGTLAVEGTGAADVGVDTLSGVMGSFNMTDSISGSVEGFLTAVKQETLKFGAQPAAPQTSHAVMQADRPADSGHGGARVEAASAAAQSAGASRVPQHGAGIGKEAGMHDLATPYGWSHGASARAPAHDAGLSLRPCHPLLPAHPSAHSSGSRRPHTRSPARPALLSRHGAGAGAPFRPPLEWNRSRDADPLSRDGGGEAGERTFHAACHFSFVLMTNFL